MIIRSLNNQNSLKIATTDESPLDSLAFQILAEDENQNQSDDRRSQHDPEHVGGFVDGRVPRHDPAMRGEAPVGHQAAVNGQTDGSCRVHGQIANANASAILLDRQSVGRGVVNRRVNDGDAGDEKAGEEGQQDEAGLDAQGAAAEANNHEDAGENHGVESAQLIDNRPGNHAKDSGHQIDESQVEGDLGQRNGVNPLANDLINGHAGEVEEVVNKEDEDDMLI